MTTRASQIEGPAKWAAVAVLGGAGLVGVGRSFFVETVHAPPGRQTAQTVRVEPAPEAVGVLAPAAADVPLASAGLVKAEQVSAQDDLTVRINVNSASVAELDLLPGIGPVYAERIVAERSTNGAFASLKDLERVRGIGPKTAAKLGPLVSFEPPELP